MKRQTQLYKTNFTFGPGATYNPTPAVIPAYPIEDLDFSQEGSYSSYNWELFFHLPFEIAVQLSKDQQFEFGDGMVPLHFQPDRRPGRQRA